MLTPSCFLKKTVGFVLTLNIIIITDTLDIDNTIKKKKKKKKILITLPETDFITS